MQCFKSRIVIMLFLYHFTSFFFTWNYSTSFPCVITTFVSIFFSGCIILFQGYVPQLGSVSLTAGHVGGPRFLFGKESTGMICAEVLSSWIWDDFLVSVTINVNVFWGVSPQIYALHPITSNVLNLMSIKKFKMVANSIDEKCSFTWICISLTTRELE